MQMQPKRNHRHVRGRNAVRERIRLARAEAEELLEQRRREIRRDLEQRMREMADEQPSAA